MGQSSGDFSLNPDPPPHTHGGEWAVGVGDPTVGAGDPTVGARRITAVVDGLQGPSDTPELP